MQKIIRNEGTRVTRINWYICIFLSFLVTYWYIFRFFFFFFLIVENEWDKIKCMNYQARNYRSNEILFNERRLILDEYLPHN